jgi:hypothetical protein
LDEPPIKVVGFDVREVVLHGGGGEFLSYFC